MRYRGHCASAFVNVRKEIDNQPHPIKTIHRRSPPLSLPLKLCVTPVNSLLLAACGGVRPAIPVLHFPTPQLSHTSTFPHLIGQLRQRCCCVLHRPMRNGMREPFGLCGPTLVATERLEKQIRDVTHRYQAEKSAQQPHDLQRIVPDLVENQTPINRNPLRHCAL